QIQRAIRLCEDHLIVESPIDRFQEALQAWSQDVQPHVDQSALAVFKTRYDDRVTQVIGALRQRALQEDDLFSYAKLKLLGDLLGDQLIHKLRSTSGRLEQEFRAIVDTLYNAAGFSHLHQSQRLQAQLCSIDAQIERLKTISSIARMFDQINAGESGEMLAARCEQQTNLLERASSLLNGLRAEVDSFFNYLNSYVLSWDNLRHYKDEMNQRLDTLSGEVRAACDNLRRSFSDKSLPPPERLDQLVEAHPHMQEAEARLAKRKRELESLARPLIQLSDYFGQELFGEARQTLETIDERTLEDHEIYEEFRVTYCGTEAVGWGEARRLVDKAWRDWQPLEDWQQQAPTYEAWQSDAQKIEQYRAQARFDDAEQLLGWVIEQAKKARNYRRKQPVVPQPCSARGQQLLAEMEQQARDYEALLREAQTVQRKLQEDRESWEKLTQRIKGLMVNLAQRLESFCESRGLLGRWAFNAALYRELQQALSSYRETLGAMEALCPNDHEDLAKIYSDSVIYRDAEDAVRDKRCGE
ncbi:MAG: hypothetical protein RML73_07915, partial [Anaerolineae bacterium]|nr:hypothetical protein [Anaerolineae bacterium]